MSADADPLEAMLDAADAYRDGNLERADDALLEAVSRIRYEKRNGGGDDE